MHEILSLSQALYLKLTRGCLAAVSNELWFNPSKGAVCGMCLKVYMSEGMPSAACTLTATPSVASCPGAGTHPYAQYVNESWAWDAKIYPARAPINLPYFIGVIIEWFDRSVMSLTQKQAFRKCQCGAA